MTDAKPTKLDKLRDKQRQLAEQIAAINAREKAGERKADTRRKILIGGAILAAYRHGDFPHDRLISLLDDALIADRDRALFDFLPPRADDSKERTPKPAPAPPSVSAAPFKPAAIDRTYVHDPVPRKENLK